MGNPSTLGLNDGGRPAHETAEIDPLMTPRQTAAVAALLGLAAAVPATANAAIGVDYQPLRATVSAGEQVVRCVRVKNTTRTPMPITSRASAGGPATVTAVARPGRSCDDGRAPVRTLRPGQQAAVKVAVRVSSAAKAGDTVKPTVLLSAEQDTACDTVRVVDASIPTMRVYGYTARLHVSRSGGKLRWRVQARVDGRWRPTVLRRLRVNGRAAGTLHTGPNRVTANVQITGVRGRAGTFAFSVPVRRRADGTCVVSRQIGARMAARRVHRRLIPVAYLTVTGARSTAADATPPQTLENPAAPNPQRTEPVAGAPAPEAQPEPEPKPEPDTSILSVHTPPQPRWIAREWTDPLDDGPRSGKAISWALGGDATHTWPWQDTGEPDLEWGTDHEAFYTTHAPTTVRWQRCPTVYPDELPAGGLQDEHDELLGPPDNINLPGRDRAWGDPDCVDTTAAGFTMTDPGDTVRCTAQDVRLGWLTQAELARDTSTGWQTFWAPLVGDLAAEHAAQLTFQRGLLGVMISGPRGPWATSPIGTIPPFAAVPCNAMLRRSARMLATYPPGTEFRYATYAWDSVFRPGVGWVTENIHVESQILRNERTDAALAFPDGVKIRTWPQAAAVPTPGD